MKELQPENLRKECDPKTLVCETTEEIFPLEEIIGQERAVRALKFGLEIKERGFNIYVAGYPGTGRTTAVKDFLEEIAKKKPVPPDWCYVNNFANPYEPKAIKLPSGRGKIFQKDMESFVMETQRELLRVFKSDEYAAKKEVTIRTIEEERNKLFVQLNEKAKEKGFVLQSTPIGLLSIPLIRGRPISDQEFLSQKTRDEIQRRREELNADLRNAIRQLRELEGKVNDELEKLNREVALYAIGHLITALREKYNEFPEILEYIEAVQNDVLENLEQFLRQREEPASVFSSIRESPLRRYGVNVVVDNSNLRGAPVILELNPTYQNLLGRIEKEAQFGILTTDFTMIRGGSLHKANGGYLVLSAEQIISNPFSWESLKMALKSERVTVEEPGERLGFLTTKGLKTEPIPLDVKVILIGNPLLYMLLYAYDLDFKELFKVKADFDTTMDRTEDNMKKYVAFICTFCRKENMKHLEASAAAKIIEYGSRLAEDQEKLSTRFAEIADIIREANFYAAQENSTYITASHVKKAIEEKIYRSNLIQKKIQEMIKRGFLLIDTEGAAVGQVNGLSVISLGDFAFGRPSRVTASIGIGREGIIDIEREAMLGGRIHTKGVMILGGYLTDKYARDKPLSLAARLVFEQSYEGVEGDSASSTELYAILSALSGLPINQNIAVTGS
ncbi:MAG: ATP-binding protein, partial [Candidatus Bathyarchaeia archaeon]